MLIESHIDLVTKVFIQKFRWYYRSKYADELMSSGNLGLIKAAKTFNDFKGNNFRGYAYKVIFHAMRRGLTEAVNLIHIPESHSYKSWKKKNAAKAAEDAKLRDLLTVETIMGTSNEPRQFPTNELEQSRLNELEPAIVSLPLRQQKIVRERFFKNKSLDEIGKSMGLSKQRVCQILKLAQESIQAKLEWVS